MPVMSSFERAFCCSAVWCSGSAAIARELRARRLGRDVLEIGAGSGSFVGYDPTRTPLASLFHRLDGSRHRLIVPDDFQDECTRNGLTISLQSRLLGHVMRFVAHKN